MSKKMTKITFVALIRISLYLIHAMKTKQCFISTFDYSVSVT